MASRFMLKRVHNFTLLILKKCLKYHLVKRLVMFAGCFDYCNGRVLYWNSIIGALVVWKD